MEKTTSTASIIAIIISLIALVLAWVAFNRTGVDLEEMMQQEIDEAMVEINANFEELEEQTRENTAEGLRETAEDVETDEQPQNAGE